jgi:hypothetical protein
MGPSVPFTGQGLREYETSLSPLDVQLAPAAS